jgi:hypothetical protein
MIVFMPWEKRDLDGVGDVLSIVSESVGNTDSSNRWTKIWAHLGLSC